MTNEIQSINQSNFKDVVTKHRKVLVKFGAPWCGPCKALEPMLEQVKDDYPDILFTEVNMDENPALGTQFNIRSIPTIMAWKNGEAQWSRVGVPNLGDLKKQLDTL